MSIDASLVLLHYNQSNCLRKTILALEQQKTDTQRFNKIC